MYRFPLVLALLPFSTSPATGADDLQAGLAVYTSHCASCHGPKGEGVAGQYAQPLAGDKSIGELTELIERTMPEGEPENFDVSFQTSKGETAFNYLRKHLGL